MLHLSPERLAALADDEPTVAEARHLAGCAFCARERSAYGALLVLARREGSRQSPPVTDWGTISAQLHDEGMITTLPALVDGPPARRSVGGRWWLRAAAAILIAASGVAYGRYAAGPGSTGDRDLATVTVSPDSATTRASYGSAAEAMEAYLRAQIELRQAAAFLAARRVEGFDAQGAEAYRARLVALDGFLGVSRAALYEAPADPVINQLYLTSLGARDATVRLISSALPEGTVLTPY